MRKVIMSVKFFVYLFVTILVIYSLDAVRMNQIFKKDKIYQARLFYFFVAISLIYLVSNFIMDFFTSSQIL